MRNWKTTLIGLVGGLLTAYSAGGLHDLKAAIPGAVLAIIGLFSKDFDK